MMKKYWKSVRRCSAKHISKSKFQNVQRFRTTFGSWDDEKVHAVVDMYKTHQLRTTFGNWDVEKVHAIVAQSTLRSQKCKKMRGMEHFWTFRCRFAWQAHGIVHPVKSEQNVRALWQFMAVSKAMAVAVQETCSSELLGGPGVDFLTGCILEHQIFWFSEMILRDRCSTAYDLASLFRGRRNTLDRWSGKLAKHIGTTPSALHSAFHFWRKFRRIVSFLMLSTSKIEEMSQTCFVLFMLSSSKGKEKCRRTVSFLMLSTSKIEEMSQNCFVFYITLSSSKVKEVSQTCFVFGVVKFQKLRKSRRIVSFLTLSRSKNEEVSQNCFVFGIVKFQKLRKSRRIVSFLTLSRSKNWGSLAE